MRLRNTSAYPTDEVRELVEFATRGINMSRVCVNVKGTSKRWGGTAYNGIPGISNAPASADYLVTLRIAPDLVLPVGPINYNWKGPDEVGPGNRYPFFTYRTWQEVIIHLAAHEARHIHQFRHGKRCSEVDCERFAEAAILRYRKQAVHA